MSVAQVVPASAPGRSSLARTRLWQRLGAPNLWLAAFGLYLTAHFVQLLPVAGELFSHAGWLSNRTATPYAGRMPSLFFLCDAPWFIQCCLVGGILASVALACRRGVRFNALYILVLYSSLYTRLPAISNPSLAYVGFALFVLVVVGRPATGIRRVVIHDAAFFAVLVVVGVSYTFAGLEKLGAPSWRDGSALFEVLASPLARAWASPEAWISGASSVWATLFGGGLRAATYGALALEVFALPLLLVRRTRGPTTLALMALHLGILCTVNFSDLTLGMLAVHGLFIDPAWFSLGRRAPAHH